MWQLPLLTLQGGEVATPRFLALLDFPCRHLAIAVGAGVCATCLTRLQALASTNLMTSRSEDHRLFLQIAEGDPKAFRRLVDQHARPLVTYLTRLMNNQHEAEEIAQEVFVRVWQNADEFKSTFRASTWLHRIGHNLAVDQLRRRKGCTEFDAELDPAPISQQPLPLMEQKQRATSLHVVLDALPLRQKMAMLLKYEQDFSNPEIASVLNLSVDAVESLLSRAKRELKDQLTSQLTSDEP